MDWGTVAAVVCSYIAVGLLGFVVGVATSR